MLRADLDVPFKVGDLLIIETGEYSDRDWSGPVRIIREFTRREVGERYKEEGVAEYDWQDRASPRGFMPWLVKEGYVEDVDKVHSWHVGSYGDFDPYNG